MFLTEEEKKMIIEALQKKISGIDWVIKNKDLDENKQDYLQSKAVKLQEIVKKIGI